ncbi:ORF6N domain-containing protein [Pedobacter frigoris]|uniref:ORF6N domain-containing protein n=1 Tax=Pedobacter frigoris TaxID=2571272 RepID=UPI0039779348
MMDRDLAVLYGVETKALNQAVKRNKERFPERFCFGLNKQETNELVTKCDRFKTLKLSTSQVKAFTEQGIASYVTAHDGIAITLSPEISRPNWNIVKDVLQGLKPLSTLSKDCPDL